MKKIILVFFTVLFYSVLSAQNLFFADAGENKIVQTPGERVIIPEKYRSTSLDMQQMKNFLWSLPSEKNILNRAAAPILELPMPDGKMAKFRVWESSIQEPLLEAKFPEMKTFSGQGIDDPYATVRFDYTPSGFHAQVLTINGSFYIDPYARGEINNYISYFRTDLRKAGTFLCEVPDNPSTNRLVTEAVCRGTQLKTYRLAVACTGEYAQAPGINAGANPAILHAAILTTVNRVVGVYEKEVAVSMILVANNNLVEFLDAASDPFTGNSNPGTLINESQTVIDANIGTANYDIGHTFSTGGGGVAQINSPCGSGKARGITGSSSPTGDAYDIDFVAHEMGHQFGGTHTFNGQVGNCSGGNRTGSTAYEPGSGTTIQAYAGICGSDNLQPNSDPFFHSISFDQISNFVVSGGGGSCGTSAPTGNSIPLIEPLLNNGVSIPVSTPFTLTGFATDPDGDAVSYCWEQWDLGPQGAWNSGANSISAPNFKSRVPKTTGSRTFPDIGVILAGFPINPPAALNGLKGETLPAFARTMKFRLIVRDNRAGGGGLASSGSDGCQTSTVYQINVVGTTGPFAVTVPNGGESYSGGSSQIITWNVVGTDAAPISVANVKISLSTDGGLTFPTVVAASTPNDGTETIVLPCISSATARIKIEAVGNIFFDISNSNFSIQQGFEFSSPAPVSSSCPVPASLLATLGTTPNCGFVNPITLSATGNPPGTTVVLTPNPINPGSNTTVTLTGTNTLSAGTYIVTVTGTATGATTKTRDIAFVITTVAPPSITTQPVNQATCVGGNAVFSIATANVSGYQWQVSTSAVPAFTNIAGATSPAYSLSTVTAAMNGNQYRVIASNCATSVTSAAVTLTVVNPVVLTTQPANQEICSGSTANFTVAGNSSQTIIYQWQVSTAAVPAFNNIPGATSATLSLTSVTTGMNSNQYRCQLSNISCTAPVTSNAAILTVRQLPTIGLIAAPLLSLLPGQTTTLTAIPGAQTTGTVTFSWFKNSVAIINAGTTRIINVENTGTYRVNIQEIFSSGLTCSNQSADVVITAVVSNKLFIFPSPNDGRFTVSYFNSGGSSTTRTVTVYDSKGDRVRYKTFTVSGPYTLLPVDIQATQKGIYYVVVGDAAGKVLADGKVLVQ